MFSTPSTNQTRSCQQPTTGLGRWATAQESASLYTHVHTIPCSGVRPPQTPEQTRDHATVETETHYIYNLYNIILVNYIIYICTVYGINHRRSGQQWASPSNDLHSAAPVVRGHSDPRPATRSPCCTSSWGVLNCIVIAVIAGKSVIDAIFDPCCIISHIGSI